MRSKWLVESVDELLDESGNIRPDSDTTKTTAEKRMATIRRAIDAWDAISEDTVRKSFCKALPR